MKEASKPACFTSTFNEDGTATCGCPSDRCAASIDGLRVGRVSILSDIHCRACKPMTFHTPAHKSTFQLDPDATHRTETFGALDCPSATHVPPSTAEAVHGPSRPPAGEADPTGRGAHEPGAKLDAGKPEFDVLLFSFPGALAAVNAVGAYGAKKYSLGGFLEVPDGTRRYLNADIRHKLKHQGGETHDKDTGELHLAHAAWNAMAVLELYIRNRSAT